MKINSKITRSAGYYHPHLKTFWENYLKKWTHQDYFKKKKKNPSDNLSIFGVLAFKIFACFLNPTKEMFELDK